MASAIKPLYISNKDTTLDKKFTYLVSDISSGTLSLKVQNTTGFSTSQILLVGEIGRENAEIIFTDSSVAPSSTHINLRAGTSFDHPQDTKVYLLDWDSIQLSHATAVSGTKSTLTISGSIGGTIMIQVDKDETIHNDTEYTSGYYFVRFYDSVNARYSDYSDAIPYSGYADNTVYSIKKRALEATNTELDTKITDEWLNSILWEARREIHNAPGKRPWRQRFGIDIGNVTAGINKIATPSDLDEPDTAKNLFAVRIGTEQELDYRDKKVIDEYYTGIPHTILNVAYTPGGMTIFLNNSRDFDASGTITVGTYTLSYSSNSISNGTLQLSSTGTDPIVVERDIWQGVSLGLPQFYTVYREGSAGTSYIVFERPISGDYHNQNIYADYYRTLVEYNSDADVLDEPEYDAFVNYLSWRIKKKKNQGLIALTDDDYLEWMKKKTSMFGNEREGQTIRMEPDVPGW